jgi:hypothetical protein
MATQDQMNDFITILMQQRNDALNKLAEVTSLNASLQRQGAKDNENADNTMETNVAATD